MTNGYATLHIAPFPGLAGTFTVRHGNDHVGWVKRDAPAHQANAWVAINSDGDETAYFPTAEAAARYIAGINPSW
jgi:hypothetical protein